MKRVPIGGLRGGVALVDDQDHALVAGFNWSRHSCGYAQARVNGRMTYMHRLILGLVPGDGIEVDHRNFDRLDNRRANIRAGTPQENRVNLRSYAGASSRYRGVSWNTRERKWHAHAQLRRRQHNLGDYETEQQAAEAVREFWTERGVEVA